jgi:hypothetical protein
MPNRQPLAGGEPQAAAADASIGRPATPKESFMRTAASRHPMTINASLAMGLLVLAAWSASSARAADERVAVLSRPHSTAAASVADVARAQPAPAVAAKPAQPAAKPSAAKAVRHGNYERDLWRHQGVG